MRLLLFSLILAVAFFAEAKPKKKTPQLAPQTFPRVGFCQATCDTLSSRVTFVDEGRENCGMDSHYVCPTVVGDYCGNTETKKCLRMEKGFCVARCDLDGKSVTYDNRCVEGSTCAPSPQCNHTLRDRNFGRVACR